jgi:hypothetical protein
LFARVCERWHLDPIAVIGGLGDDVLDYDFRAALAFALVAEREQPQDDEAARHRGLIERTKDAGEQLRRRLTGG